MSESRLPDHLSKRVVIVGVGNSLFGDDGFGPATVQQVLQSAQLPSDVCVLDVGTAVMPILLDMIFSDVGPKRLLILDTVDLGRIPGELVRLSVEDLPQTRGDFFSFHTFSARRILEELKRRKGVDVIILACQAEDIPSEIREGISRPVQEAVYRAASVVLELAKA